MGRERDRKVKYLSLAVEYCTGIREKFHDGTMESQVLLEGIRDMRAFVPDLREILEFSEYVSQREVFDTFHDMCGVCQEQDFLETNLTVFLSMLDLFIHSLEKVLAGCENKRRCSCCGREVMYSPLSGWYFEMQKRYGAQVHWDETLNKEEYLCPVCGSSDRDRMIISFLQKAGLCEAEEHAKVLQIAPAATIETWIQTCCPHVDYESTDLYMDGVTFGSDIMDMNMVEGETYDLVICSHVLEHVKDDRKAMRELKRILKPQGLLVFLVPISLDMEDIDEEWGLSEAENWRRFGQGDHCRRYGKSGLMRRLEEEGFYVNALGKEYFGEEVFEKLALTDTSTLYVLTKDQKVKLDLRWEYTVDDKLLEDGPLVSVILPAYNHEAFVAEAIESVLNQTYQNIELIVADDGSTDRTVEIMKRYAEHFAGEFYFPDNAGRRDQELKRKTTGKYIALASSDDFWEPEKLALQVDYLEKHEEVAACFSWGRYIDENKKELDEQVFIQKNRSRYEWMKLFWQFGNVLCHPSILIRREEYIRLNAVGNACRQLPDFYMWLELVQHAEIYVIPKVLVKMTRFCHDTNENTSAYTEDNILRSLVESGAVWDLVIRNMEDSYFVRTFCEYMRNPEAKEEVEIICEKFFLLLESAQWRIQEAGIRYFLEMYEDERVRECFTKQYSFSVKDFWEIMTKKGRP